GGDTTDREFLAEVRDRTWKTYENQEYQFEDLVEKLEIHRDPGRNPLFDVMLALQNMQDLVTQEGVELEDTGLTMEPYPFEDGISKFDMTLHAFEAEGQLILSFEYCTKLFKKETIETFSRYLIRVLDVVLKEPQSGICEIEIASEQDKQAILADFNDTRKEYPVNETIRQLFEYQVTETPDETAVAFREQRLSYKELNEKVNRLARTLHSHGVAIGTIVAVKTAPSIDMVVGTLAVLKTGGTYMPIDPDYPEERIKYMIADSGVQLLLTSGSPAETDTMKTLSLEDETIYHEDAANPGYGDSAAEPAYIMYTSGSTGKPKGVVVEHRSILRLVKNTNFIELNSPGRILQTGAFAFDASTFEIWGALLNGLSLYTVDKETVLSPGSLKETIEKNNIDTMWMTSPFFNQMVQSQIDIFAPLKHLLVGGDILNPVYIGKVKDKYPGLKIINGYGPTENTTFSTTYAIEKETKGNIPIGKPIANSTAYILDEYGHLLPVGAAGELCVGGDGVARGYLNNPELSAEKFLLNPFDDGKSYIYKTGDRARWLSDGNIEFLGRMDYQVKIRGFRIEPGEIEHQLLGHEKVTDAFVDIRENEKGDRFLCGYVVSAETFDTSELREFLARSLPDYMIPQYFVWMEKMPLTPNGKIDRNVLKKLEALASGKGEYVAPKTGMEKSITEIWQEVLGEEKIGIHDNFFEVGGNSLKIVQLSSKLKDVIGKDIPVATMFRYPTISSFARYVEHGETAGEMLSEDEISETIDEMDGAMQMFGEIEDE
ncbi:MAG: amino acid adenylation domain-containing protein, partial [bacterium]|nr:amino acid adenylation domain-containing protein [bacterium]